MPIYEVFRQPVEIRYKTSRCSKATVFYIIASLLTFIPPLLFSFKSQGFWKKIGFYREQPEIRFKHHMILVLESSSPEKAYIWSSFQNLNKLLKGSFKSRIPLIKHIEMDEDRDGKNDKLEMTIQVPLTDEEIHSVKLLLFFDYKLHLYSSFQMEGLAYIHYNSPLAGNSLNVVGELSFHQREPLWHAGKDQRYNVAIIDESENDIEVFKLENIFRLYNQRNVTTVFKSMYPVWLAGRSVDEPFTISITIIYPEETIQYRLGFWQLLKWAWVQYLAVLVIFFYLVQKIKTHVFQHQLVSSIVISPLRKDD